MNLSGLLILKVLDGIGQVMLVTETMIAKEESSCRRWKLAPYNGSPPRVDTSNSNLEHKSTTTTPNEILLRIKHKIRCSANMESPTQYRTSMPNTDKQW